MDCQNNLRNPTCGTKNDTQFSKEQLGGVTLFSAGCGLRCTSTHTCHSWWVQSSPQAVQRGDLLQAISMCGSYLMHITPRSRLLRIST